MGLRRFAVVAWSGSVPLHLSPRGQRTTHLINALEPHGDVARVGGENIPRWLAGDGERTASSWYRRLGRELMHSILIDKYEIAARRALRSWSPRVDAAVLVGHPFSPLSLAAHRLASDRVPYIVDVGDPWVLTNPHPDGRWLRRARAARWERELWSSARGVVVTTAGQGDALKTLFPHLRVLVRPNGYNALLDQPPTHVPRQLERELRLVHYGSLHGARVDFTRIFENLAHSGRWDKITLCQYGPDWEGALDSVSRWADVECRSPLPWVDIVAQAHAFHAAVVIGWRNPAQMPSKTVQYLTLPIPRIAIATADSADALATYVADKPGWILLADTCRNASNALDAHLSKPWNPADLRAPEAESWEAVERVLGDFAVDTLAYKLDAKSMVRRAPHPVKINP
jgi:glycosyltransferase involved in cell wall biosynthesis